MTASYSTLDTTIRRGLLGEGDEDKGRYVRAFIHARRWYEVEYTGGVEKGYGHKSVPLEVGPDRVVDLPADYVEYQMLGIRRGEQVHNLLHNPRLVPVPLAEQGAASAAPAYTYPYVGLRDNGVDLLGYGYPSGRQGEFSIDRAARTLLVSSAISPGQELYLSYLSDSEAACESSLIHPLAEAWLEFYVLHFLHKKNNPGLAADYKRDAEGARSDYLIKRASLQLGDVDAVLRAHMARPI